MARASNGDTVTVNSSGTLDAGARAADGSGTFEHRSSDGTLLASGTFTVTGLIQFQSYGCGTAGGQPIPPDLCGGKAILPIHITAHPASGGTVSLDGELTVTCELGTPPAGGHEGIRINVNDVINFNKSVSGETVFIHE